MNTLADKELSRRRELQEAENEELTAFQEVSHLLLLMTPPIVRYLVYNSDRHFRAVEVPLCAASKSWWLPSAKLWPARCYAMTISEDF